MGKRNIINLITFARGENQAHSLDYMLECTREQVELYKRHSFSSTVLLMYDAFIEPEFYNYLIPEVESGVTEVGIWFEIPAQLVKKAGLIWRGREGFTWDWHNNVGFLIGYTQEERMVLIDTAMESFKEIFGFYPQVVGSWHIDAFSLNYLYEKYNIKGSCMCRDQWGTDGYTLWGGYEPIYYPSKNNMFCPASTKENQINIPMIKMLGADPIYNFEIPYMWDRLGNNEPITMPATLEPTLQPDNVPHEYNGTNKEWANWYFNMMINDSSEFSYAQTGQENGFGWFRVKNGITNQCDLLDKYVKEGSIIIEKMSETCDWFVSNYKTTPNITIDVKADWTEIGRKAVWFYGNYYRSSIIFENNKAWIRELRLFDENYKEPHLVEPCPTNATYFDNLPLVDGTLWSTKSKESGGLEQRGIRITEKDSRAGLYPVSKKNNIWKAIETEQIETVNEDNISTVKLILTDGGEIVIKFTEKKIYINLPDDAGLMLVHNDNDDIVDIKENRIEYCHKGYEYSLDIVGGTISKLSDIEAIIRADDNEICFDIVK